MRKRKQNKTNKKHSFDSALNQDRRGDMRVRHPLRHPDPQCT